MSLTMESRVTLNDGNKMPVLGLGMWQAGSGKETRKAVAYALEIGYRLFDTAKLYGNERDLGAAVRDSNYTIRHLEELLPSTATPPAVNQVEFHPFLYQRPLLEFSESKRIQLEAYSPLTRGHRLDHPVITQVAAKYGRTPAQVLI